MYSSVELNGANLVTVNVTTYPGEISWVNFVPTLSLSPSPRFSIVAFGFVISNHLICFVKRSVFLSAYFFQWFACSSSESGGSATVSAISANTTSNLPLRLAPAFSNSAYTALIELLNSSKLLAICSFVALSLPSNSLATFRASSFLTTAFSTAGFASTFKSFLLNSVLATLLVTSASEATWVNSFLASFTSTVCFASDLAFSSAFLTSFFAATPFTWASVTTVFKAFPACTCASTSACVAASLANTAFAAANASLAAETAAWSASGADFTLLSNAVIASFKAPLLTSAFASVLGVSAPTFAATAAATLSLVFSTLAAFSTALGDSSFAPTFVALSLVVLFDTSSDAWATAPAPKKILAPITTDAVPTLNFLIE